MMLFMFLFAVSLASFTSGSEIAFSSASRIRAYSRLREGKKWARLSLSLIENPRRYLTTTLVGTNVGMVLASVITTRFAHGTGIVWLEPVLIILLSLFMLIFAEMIPKHLMLVSSERAVSNLSLPLYILRVILFPIILIADSISSLIVGRRAGSRVLESKSEILGLLTDSSSDAGPIAEKILRMNDIRISNVMRKLRQMPVTTIGDARKTVLDKLISTGYPFVLVCERDGETIRGYADGNSVVKSGSVLDENSIAGLPYFDEGDDLISVTASLRKSAAPAGIVLGSTGQPAGIAILDDIIDSLLGKTGASSALKTSSEKRIEWHDGKAVIN